MPLIGKRCHELRVRDENRNWRIFYYLNSDAIVILAVEKKTTPKATKEVIDLCQKRLGAYQRALKDAD